MQILLVDDDPFVRESVGACLRELGHAVHECASGTEGLAAFSQNPLPMVLSDIRMQGMDGISFTRAIKALPEGQRTDVVLFTGYGDMETAVEALRAGAYDYILKPVSRTELASLTDRIAEHQALLQENRILTEKFQSEVEHATEETRRELSRLKAAKFRPQELENALFHSASMKQAAEQARIYHGDRSVPVIIQGETGTGKEIIARLIHHGDDFCPAPFFDINCAAIPAPLFESELFGYEAGAFTGASTKGCKGKLDMAGGGTLFLDEITEMPMDIQAKFLRVIERKEYYRVGGLRKITADVRILCATNADISRKIADGKLREDLYYRLCVGHIGLRPLRERPEDILPLALQFLARFSREKKKSFRKLSPGASKMLQNRNWSGNVRELKNLIEWIVLMFDGPELTEHHITTHDNQINVASQGSRTSCKVINPLDFDLPAQPFPIEEYNLAIVEKVLAMMSGNKTDAALYLGISRQTLYTMLERMKKNRQV